MVKKSKNHRHHLSYQLKNIFKLMLKKIAVIGIGNVGTFLSAVIIQSEECDELVAVEKDSWRIRQLEELGFCYKIADANPVEIKSSKVRFATSLHEINERFDAIFLAVKSYDLTTEFYFRDVAPFLKENAKVVLVQNGYPSPEIVSAIGNKAVVMVVNAGFSLDENGSAITNKTMIDLPYGDFAHQKNSAREVGNLFTNIDRQIQARFDSNIEIDIMKKAQYACIGAYCAVEAFKRRASKDRKFTFGNLSDSNIEEVGKFTKMLRDKDCSATNQRISAIAQEVQNLSEIPLLSESEIQERIAINSNIENSLVNDARNGRRLERGIVDNLLSLARNQRLELPTLENLSQALEIIESDGWRLEQSNIQAVNDLFSDQQRGHN